MSQLSQSLEKRIQELTASIEAQRAELAAYQQVLQMELKGRGESLQVISEPIETQEPSTEEKPPADGKAATPYSGTKTDLVLRIIASHGDQGAAPKDIDAGFAARHVGKSKNFIYNTLGYFVSSKKVVRRDGRYFIPVNSRTAHHVPAAPKKATKRKLSPEGLRRIREALRKRWAAQKGTGSSTTKTRPASKAAKKKSS